MRRILTIVVLALLVLLISLAGFAAFLLYDENFLKDRLSGYVYSKTGRELVIEGPLKLGPGRDLVIRAQSIRLQNAPWASQPDMLRIGQLDVTLNIPSLFSETPHIQMAAVKDCQFVHVEGPTGKSNWALFDHMENTIEPDKPESLPIRLDDARIDNCQIYLDSESRQDALQLTVESFSLKTSEQTRVDIQGSGVLNGEDVSLQGWVAPLDSIVKGGALQHEIHGRYGDMSFDSEGTVEDLLTFNGANLRTRLRGTQFSKLSNALGLPPFAEGRFDIRLDIEDQGQLINLEFDGDLGKLQATANGNLDNLVSPGFGNMSFEVTGPDLALLSEAFGISDMVSERFSLHGSGRFEQGVLEARQLVIETPQDRFEAAGTLGPPPLFADSSMNIKFTTTDIGRWHARLELPESIEGRLDIEGNLSSDAEGIFSTRATLGLENSSIDVAGSLGPVAGPLDPNLNIEATIQSLNSAGTRFGRSHLPDSPINVAGNIEIKGKTIYLSKVNLGLSGHGVLINGHVVLVEQQLGGLLDVRLISDDAQELGRMFNITGIPRKPLALQAVLESDHKRLGFEVREGFLGEIQFAVNGEVADLKHPLGIEANVDISAARFDELAFLFPEANLPAEPFSISGIVHNRTDEIYLESLHIRLGELEASAAGSINRANDFDLVLEAKGPDGSVLDSYVNQALEPEPFLVRTHLHGNPSAFNLDRLEVESANNKIQGQLGFKKAEQTQIKGSLHAEFLDLRYWTENDVEETQIRPDPDKYMFGDKAINEMADILVDVDIDFSADQLKIGNGTLQDLKLGLQLSPNYMEFNPIQFKGEKGGTVQGKYIIDSTGGKPGLQFELHGQNARLGLVGLEGQDPATLPPVDIDIELSGFGVTERELASSANGSILVNFGAGMINSFGASLFFSDFITNLISTINPFTKETGLQKLSCTVMFARVEDGVVALGPIIGRSDKITVLAGGVIDLNSEEIDVDFRAQPRKGLGVSVGSLVNPFVGVGGHLAKPALEFTPGESVVEGGLAIATFGLSLVARSMWDRYFSSKDPCGDALRVIESDDK